jgi:hypothetical protein
MYYVELAYLQFLQQNGIMLANLETLDEGMIITPGTAYVAMWTYVLWGGQQAGRGDNSDGKGTNLLWLNTGVSEDLGNVSPRLQAAQDWVAAGNVAPPELLAPFSHSPMIRSAATHCWHGLVMTKVNLPLAAALSARKRWFPGLSRIRKSF